MPPKAFWERMIAAYPEIAEGSTNKYQNWELVDPEKWVPDGYVCVRVDSRGAGRSPGFSTYWSPRETQGFLRLHRVGCGAAMEQRQGRTERHLLLRDEPMVGRLAATAASGGDLRLGGCRRLLSRSVRGTAASYATSYYRGSSGRFVRCSTATANGASAAG